MAQLSIQNYIDNFNQRLNPTGKMFNASGADEQGMLSYYAKNQTSLDQAFGDVTSKNGGRYVQAYPNWDGNNTTPPPVNTPGGTANPSAAAPVPTTKPFAAPAPASVAAPGAPGAPVSTTAPTLNAAPTAAVQAQPISPADLANYTGIANNAFDPNTQANTTALEAKLKQTLATGDTNVQNDLSSRGFLRSGEQITRTDMAHTIAEADMALQDAGFKQSQTTAKEAYVQTQAQQDLALRQGNAGIAQTQYSSGMQANAQNNATIAAQNNLVLQTMSQNAGLSQQDFSNMQTELGRIASVASTAATQTLAQQNQAFTQGVSTATLTQNAGGLIQQLVSLPNFTAILGGLQSNPAGKAALVQMLQDMGINVQL